MYIYIHIYTYISMHMYVLIYIHVYIYHFHLALYESGGGACWDAGGGGLGRALEGHALHPDS